MIPTRPRDMRNLLVALDIGTSKIVTLVAEITPEDTLNLIGMGSHPSRGLKKGVVVNIESTVNAIQRSLEEAELMADAKIKEVITGIAGSHIKSFNSHGMVAIKDKEVAQYDIDRVIETARAVSRSTSAKMPPSVRKLSGTMSSSRTSMSNACSRYRIRCTIESESSTPASMRSSLGPIVPRARPRPRSLST